MITIKDNQISSDKWLHRKGSDFYFKRCVMLPGDTKDAFEEVDSVPEVDVPINEINEQN